MSVFIPLQVGVMDPEDAKSLDSNEGVVALAEERSENNSSNSDIVHVEREEAELLAEGDGEELQESMMSVLGTESELAALRAEMKEEEDGAAAAAATSAGPALSHTALIPDAPQPLLVLEEPVVLEAPDSLSAVPSLPGSTVSEATPDPVSEIQPEPPAPVPASAPEPHAEVPSVVLSAASVVESSPPFPSPIKEPAAPPAPAPVLPPEPAAEPVSEPAPEAVLEPAVGAEPTFQEAQPEVHPEVPEPKAVEVAAAPVLEAPIPPPVEAPVQAQAVEPASAPASEPAVEPEPEPEPEPIPESSELPVLLYGGAALVVMAAVAAYGVLAYRKK